MSGRVILWNIPPPLMGAVYALTMLALGFVFFWFARRARLWSAGGPSEGQGGWRAGVSRLADYLVTHRTIRRDPYAGVMHLGIFWGFVILLIATTLVAIEHYGPVPFLHGTFYDVFKVISNLGGVAFVAGISMALWRRVGPSKAARLVPTKATVAVLCLLLAIAVTGFLTEALRVAATGGAAPAALHRAIWSTHAALVMAFFATVPLTLMRHVLLGAYSVMRPAARVGRLSAGLPDQPGTALFRQFDLLQADACLTCGRCVEVCPAHAAGKPLSPRSVVLGVRAMLDQPGLAAAAAVPSEALWSCTTCNACDAACPVNIHVVDKIATLRRHRVEWGDVPATAAEALESTAQRFNPFNRPNSQRLDWANGLNVPVAAAGEAAPLLYWIGCSGAFDPAGREVARSMIKILSMLKVEFKVLGKTERCSGDPARRLGEEGLWEELATHNQETFASHQVQTILTHCPHCLNSFKNEYSALGKPMPRVVHHSQWLQEQIRAGKLAISKKTAGTVTFHDPCYLARADGEVEAPRAVLAEAGAEPKEMGRSGKQGFCCGGGGGQMWLDVRGKTRVETIRAEEAAATGAATVATGCPFCRVMLEAGRAGLGDAGTFRVKDIAELVAEGLA